MSISRACHPPSSLAPLARDSFPSPGTASQDPNTLGRRCVPVEEIFPTGTGRSARCSDAWEVAIPFIHAAGILVWDQSCLRAGHRPGGRDLRRLVQGRAGHLDRLCVDGEIAPGGGGSLWHRHLDRPATLRKRTYETAEALLAVVVNRYFQSGARIVGTVGVNDLLVIDMPDALLLVVDRERAGRGCLPSQARRPSVYDLKIVGLVGAPSCRYVLIPEPPKTSKRRSSASCLGCCAAIPRCAGLFSTSRGRPTRIAVRRRTVSTGSSKSYAPTGRLGSAN